MASLMQQAKSAVIERLTTGDCDIGDVLPPSAELAGTIGCSEATVDRALTDLAREGVVRRIRRRGTVIVKNPRHREGRACLLLSGDAHMNGLLAEPIFTSLMLAGWDVDVVPASSDLTITIERCRHLRHRPNPAETLVSLFTPAPWLKTEMAAYDAIRNCFPRRVVFHDIVSPEADPQACWVGVNQPGEVRVVMEHLVRNGHRRIAVAAGVRPEEYSRVYDDAEMCRHMIEMLGGTCFPVYFRDDYVEHLPAQFAEHGITAYWAITDYEALCAVNELHRAGVDVPGDISVIGRNDTPWCTQITPALSSVSWNPPAVAKAISHAVIQMRIAPDTTAGTVRLVEPKLIARDSSGAAPAAETVVHELHE